MDIKDIISSLFIFQGTDFDELDRKFNILSSVTKTVYSDKEVVFSSESNGLPLIVDGSAVIVSKSGKKKAVLRRLKKGDVFGAATLFLPADSHKTIVLSDGGCTVALLPLSVLSTILENVPRCSTNYIKFLSERISFLNRKITAFTAGSAEAKLAVYLMGFSPDGKSFNIPVSFSELSSMLGIGRASLYRAFDFFVDNGIISKNGKEISVLRNDDLKNLIK